MSETLHWLLLLIGGAAAATAATLFLIWPLLARRAGRPSRAAYELTLLKRQLREIDRDLERGAISAAEAEGARRELGRKVLAANDALERDPGYAPAPERFSKLGAAIAAGAMIVGGLVVYAVVGTPGAIDRPLAGRDLAAERRGQLLSQADAESRFGADVRTRGAQQAPAPLAQAIAAARGRLSSNPADPEAKLALADLLRRANRPYEAWPLIEAAIAELGIAAPQGVYPFLGESMVLAAGGYVSREAADAFSQAAGAPASRYYLAIASVQRGEPRTALAAWMALLADARAGTLGVSEGFAAQLEAQIRRLAEQMGLDADRVIATVNERVPQSGGQGEGGQEQEQGGQEQGGQGQVGQGQGREEQGGEERVQGGEGQGGPIRVTDEQLAMIEGMVSGLAARLETEPSDLEGWVMLVRSYTILGRADDARAALTRARGHFEDNAEATATLTQIAAQLGLEAGTQ